MSIRWDTKALEKKVDDVAKRNTKEAALYLVGIIRTSFGSAPRQLTRGSVKAQKRYEARLAKYREWEKYTTDKEADKYFKGRERAHSQFGKKELAGVDKLRRANEAMRHRMAKKEISRQARASRKK